MNREELKAMALRKGVKVTLPDGTVFNSAGMKVEVAKAPAAKKAEPTIPVQSLEPPRVNITGLDKMADAFMALAEKIDSGERKVEFQVEGPPAWTRIEFKVTERDAGGNIRAFVAERIK